MIRPGDIVVFTFLRPPSPASVSGLARTTSTYGHDSIEYMPVAGDMYVMCGDGGFRHWPVRDVGVVFGWEFIMDDGVAYVRTAQYGFEPVEVLVRTKFMHMTVPPEASTDLCSHEGTIHDADAGEEYEVTSIHSKTEYVWR